MLSDNLHTRSRRKTTTMSTNTALTARKPSSQHKTQLKMTIRQTTRERRWTPAVALLLLAAIDLIFTTGALQEASTSTMLPEINSNQTNLTIGTNSTRRRILLPAECASKATCNRSTDSNNNNNELVGMHRRSVPLCRCDEHCKKFGDCCQDSAWADTSQRRLELGAVELRRRRREFQCRMISPNSGHLLVKAKCNTEWLYAQEDRVFAEHTRQKCELTHKNEPAKNKTDVPPLPDDWIQADPMGSMIPVTDRLTGITYLNSHCVRCNLHEDNIDRIATSKQLIYWTPMVKCNYDPELGDDRNKLYELLAAKRGDALKYSPKYRRWFINMDALKTRSSTIDTDNATATTTTTTTTASPLEPEVASRLNPGAEGGGGGGGEDEEQEQQKRSCSIMPTIPNGAEHLMRRCVPNLIDECLSPPLPTDCELMRQARVDCIYNHQALVYSFNTTSVYFNLGCARCNRERSIHCKPPKRRRPAPAGTTIQLRPQSHSAASYPSTASTPTGRKLDAPALTPENETSSNSVVTGTESVAIDDASMDTGPLDEGGPINESGETLESMSRSTSSGSFAVLFDMEPLRHSDAAGAADVVGQAKRCFGNQYFDFFENKCRCAVCGIWKRYINGACVDIPEWQREGSNLTPPPWFLATSTTSGEMPARDNGTQNTKREAGNEFWLVNETHLVNAAQAAADKRPPTTTTTPSSILKPTPVADLNSVQRAKQQPQAQLQSQPVVKQQQQQPEIKETNLNRGQGVQLVAGGGGGSSSAVASTGELSAMLSDESIFRHFEQLPVATFEARWAYSGCPKTNVPPTNYRLFNITELNRYQTSRLIGQAQQVNKPGAGLADTINGVQRPDSHLRRLRSSELELVWAYVAPWNVTLPPGNYELRRTGMMSADGLHDEMELYICIPHMPRGEDKFDRHMVWLTTLGLLVSILSLVCYLTLYFLSSLDLRHLVVSMSTAGKASDSLKDAALSRKYRKSCSSTHSSAGRSRSLSSRGVACLAGSLLAAYVFFMLGNQLQYTSDKAAALRLQQEAQESERLGLLTNCKLLAAATVCAFLMAFNWMFLLSFDIWRILRLATYQMRAPSRGSQSMRFFIYATLAAFSSILITLVALGIDQWDPYIRCGNGAPEELLSASTFCPLDVAKHRNGFDRFVHRYKPYFGHQPGSCWFVNRRALALFFGLPVALIITANLLFFLHSSYMVLRTSSRSKLSAKSQAKQQQMPRTITVTSTDSKYATGLESHFSSGKRHSVTLLEEPKHRQDLPPPSQQPDFTQQNALTTSSLSSVRTMQSAMSMESSEMQSNNSRRGSSSCPSTNGADFEELAPETLSKLTSHNTDGATSPQQQQQQQEQQVSFADTEDSESKSPPDSSQTDHQTDHLVINLEQARELQRQMQQIVEIEKRREAFQRRQSGCEQKSSVSLASQLSNNSLGSNLAQRYDSSKTNLAALMSSMGKDYRLYCRLSTIMGVTWLTGLLASLVDHSETLWYIFVLLNTLQGLFIFIAFGFKRSRLTNLEILFNYATFKIRRWTRGGEPISQ